MKIVKMTKKIVKRGVTELITPGVALNDQILDESKRTANSAFGTFPIRTWSQSNRINSSSKT